MMWLETTCCFLLSSQVVHLVLRTIPLILSFLVQSSLPDLAVPSHPFPPTKLPFLPSIFCEWNQFVLFRCFTGLRRRLTSGNALSLMSHITPLLDYILLQLFTSEQDRAANATL